MTEPVRLDQRAVVSVNGPDAESFLQGLVTQDVLGLARGQRRYAALLTPQGKIIADMILERSDEGFLVDCDRDAALLLLKRLNLFRLRARVTIEARPDLAVIAFDGSADPRSPEAPPRRIGPPVETQGDPLAYHAMRIAAGLAEQGADFGADEVFPADINMDLQGGVDFRKGCFVGQEVVSRMKRRGIARRRTLRVGFHGEAPAPPCPLLANDFEIGTLTSVAGATGLARVRIDRLAEAERDGEGFSASGVRLAFHHPDWLAGEIAGLEASKSSRAD
ncbi:MAG: folate-binding protein [Alphaproteobacteria bacterium]|nr:folate-binding protein [Alphaproteobacteria bacterium]